MEAIIPFSVILPVYKNDSPLFFDDAMQSLHDQTLRATEVVLIQDGPLTPGLDAVVAKWQTQMSELNVLALPKNVGLSAALNAGIKHAKHEWLARMDSDDICRKDRFEKQMTYIKKHAEISILGGWIAEFEDNPAHEIAVRKLPETHEEIFAYAKWRCPFNHMTVMYKKSVMLDLGLYKTVADGNTEGFGEDYELWARFLMRGYKGANLQEVLVNARTDSDFYTRRRRGLKYFKSEVKELNDLYKLGLINPFHYAVHFGMKAIVRFSPPALVKCIYKGIRKTS